MPILFEKHFFLCFRYKNEGLYIGLILMQILQKQKIISLFIFPKKKILIQT